MSESKPLLKLKGEEKAEEKARQIREYAIGGWFDLAKLKFEFEALPKLVTPLYDGPGWFMEFSRSEVKWVRYEDRGKVPMYTEDFVWGGVVPALHDAPALRTRSDRQNHLS